MFIAKRQASPADYAKLDRLDAKASAIMAKTGRRSLLTGGANRERQQLAENGGYLYWSHIGWNASKLSAKEYKKASAIKALFTTRQDADIVVEIEEVQSEAIAA